jgi:hypothetical protein
VTTARDHHYTSNLGPADHRHLTCACGHAEPIDGDFSAAIARMNAHIRASAPTRSGRSA